MLTHKTDLQIATTLIKRNLRHKDTVTENMHEKKKKKKELYLC